MKIFITAQCDTIQVDLDSISAVEQFIGACNMAQSCYLFDNMKVEDYSCRRSRSGKIHVYLKLSWRGMTVSLNKAQRCRMQLLLGSDPRRELLSLCRYVNNQPMPWLLIEETNAKILKRNIQKRGARWNDLYKSVRRSAARLVRTYNRSGSKTRKEATR